MATGQSVGDEKKEVLFPNGGWDVHHHIFEPSRFPYSPERHLTPPPATIKQFLEFKAKLGITNSVLTHGLSYGDDCSSLLEFLSELGSNSTRGIAVIDPTTVTADELKSLHRVGIRGIRVNLYRYDAMHDVERQKTALTEHARVLGAHCRGWSMAFTHMHPEFWRELKPVIEREFNGTGVYLVTDHFALLKAASMLNGENAGDVTKQPGFGDVVDLVRSGALYIKISAPYRQSEMAPHYADMKPLVRALLDANPRRVLWGSDWPHTPRMKVRTKQDALTETPFLEVDDLAWLRSLRSWMSDEEWDLVMVKNPTELYGGGDEDPSPEALPEKRPIRWWTFAGIKHVIQRLYSILASALWRR